MPHAAKLVGFELIVPNLTAALALFVDALGLDLVDRRASTDPSGEIAVLAIGDAAITLLEPAEHGPGNVLPKRDPRLSQIVLGVASDELDGLAEHVVEAGIPVQAVDTTRCFLPPVAMRGFLGISTAVVLTAPPASRTIRSPAATSHSHAGRRVSMASKRPSATRHIR